MTLAAIGHSIQEVSVLAAVRESVYVYPILLSVHLTCIATIGGLILLTNLRLLGWMLTDIPVDALIASFRPWKQLGFVVMASCGALLAGSKAEEYLANPFFLVKMALLGGLAVHGLYFGRRVYRADAARISLSEARAAAILSLVLWIGLVSMGRWIAYYDPPSSSGV